MSSEFPAFDHFMKTPPVPFDLFIPTLNAGTKWPEVIRAIQMQRIAPARVTVVDSGSRDQTVALAQKAGFDVQRIEQKSFNHATTRQIALNSKSRSQAVVFMTQDVILATPDAFERLLQAFKDPEVGIAFGRQLPGENAPLIEQHARFFNYPQQSYKRQWSDRKTYGIKTAFCSDAFSAYRLSALNSVGGFDRPLIGSEDLYVAAKLLRAGWKLAYQAEAQAFHFHNYTLSQEFQRYFDIGAFHGQQPWIREALGAAEGEGKRFVLSELKFLWARRKSLIIYSLMRTLSKLLGYRLGMHYRRIPKSLLARFSMNENYWL